MSVTAEEFTGVGGLLNVAAMFPGLSATKRTALFTAWLTAAGDVEAITDLSTTALQDDGTRLYLKVRAWDAVVQRLGTLPMSVAADGEGSSGYVLGQLEFAIRERDLAQAELDDLVALDEDADAGDYAVIQSLR